MLAGRYHLPSKSTLLAGVWKEVATVINRNAFGVGVAAAGVTHAARTAAAMAAAAGKHHAAAATDAPVNRGHT